MELFGSVTLSLLGVLVSILLIVVVYIKQCYNYWKSRGVDQLEPKFLYGDIKELASGQFSFGEQFLDIYKKFKAKGVRHGGVYFFMKPNYIPIDPYLIKDIMVKDFEHFINHGIYYNEKNDPLSCHLFALEDAKWKDLRQKLSPTFTSGKMKMMFQTFVDCTNGLDKLFKDLSITQEPVDIKDVLGRFTTDIIGSCAFGIECNSLINPDAEFRKNGKRIFESTKWEAIKRLVLFTVPRPILNASGFKITAPEVETFFMKVIKETVSYREKNNVRRNDFIQLMVQLKNKEDGLNMNEISAQSYVFFLAGFETSSTTMTFALYEIAVNQDVQEKVRVEINTILEKYNNKLTYEAVMEMDYLDKVIKETLRKYPPVGALQRVCNKTYKVPGTNVVIEKGINLQIPILGLHMDPQYYPDPDKFDPERFSEENKAARPPCTWMPFGEGPRLCIGLRFGLLQSKVGLITTLRNYKITLNSKTKLPLKMDKHSFVSSTDGGMWLNIHKID